MKSFPATILAASLVLFSFTFADPAPEPAPEAAPEPLGPLVFTIPAIGLGAAAGPLLGAGLVAKGLLIKKAILSNNRRRRFRGRRSAEPIGPLVITLPAVGAAAAPAIGAGLLVKAGLLAKGALGSRNKRSAEPEPLGPLVITLPAIGAAAGPLIGAGLLAKAAIIKKGFLANRFGGSRRFRGKRSADPEPLGPLVITLPAIGAAAGPLIGAGLLAKAAIIKKGFLANRFGGSRRFRGKRSADPEPLGPLVIALPAVGTAAAPLIGAGLLAKAAILKKGFLANQSGGRRRFLGKRSADPEPIFDGGVITIPAGLVTLKALGLLGIAKAGLIAGSSRRGFGRRFRGKRSAEPEPLGPLVIALPAVGTAAAPLIGAGLLAKAAILKKGFLANQSGGRRRFLGKRSADPEPLGPLVIALPAVGTAAAPLIGAGLLAKAAILKKGFLANQSGGRRRFLGKRSADPAPIFDGGVITIPAGLVALKALGLLGIAKAGIIAGSSRGRNFGRRRYGRSVEEDNAFDSDLFAASTEDVDDCAKKTICLVNAKDAETLNEEESFLRSVFAEGDKIDYSRRSVEFDLAALLGRSSGPVQCETIYQRCPHSLEKLFELAQTA